MYVICKYVYDVSLFQISHCLSQFFVIYLHQDESSRLARPVCACDVPRCVCVFVANWRVATSSIVTFSEVAQALKCGVHTHARQYRATFFTPGSEVAKSKLSASCRVSLCAGMEQLGAHQTVSRIFR